MQSRLPIAVLGLASLASFALLLFLARQQTFFNDEWWFILGRQDWNLDSFMAPHNSHWILVQVAVWKPLLEVVGLRSYMPYLALTLLLHLVLAAGVYRVCSRQAGVVIGLAAAVRLLFFGYANEVLFQAFMFGVVGATAAGTWALALFMENASRRRLAVASALLVVAVASSGLGLFFIAAIGAACVLYRARRRDLWIVVPAIAAYAAWLVAFGRSSFDDTAGLSLWRLADFAWRGIAATVGATAGSTRLGTIGVAVIALAVAWELIRTRRLAVGAVAGLTGLLAEFVIIGLAREEEFGVDQALAPRYAYTGAVFLLIAAAAWLGPRLAGLTAAPMHQRLRQLSIGVVAAALIVVTAADLRYFPAASSFWQARSDATRATVSIFLEYGGQPAVPADQRSPATPTDVWVEAIPPPAQLRALVARYGSPLSDALVPGQPTPPDSVYDEGLLAIVGPAIKVSVPATMPANVVPLTVVSAGGVSLDSAGGCLQVQPTAADPFVVVRTEPDGRALALLSADGDDATLALSARGTWPVSTAVALDPNVPALVSLPDLGPGFAWLARLQPSGGGATRVCLTPQRPPG